MANCNARDLDYDGLCSIFTTIVPYRYLPQNLNYFYRRVFFRFPEDFLSFKYLTAANFLARNSNFSQSCQKGQKIKNFVSNLIKIFYRNLLALFKTIRKTLQTKGATSFCNKFHNSRKLINNEIMVFVSFMPILRGQGCQTLNLVSHFLELETLPPKPLMHFRDHGFSQAIIRKSFHTSESWLVEIDIKCDWKNLSEFEQDLNRSLYFQRQFHTKLFNLSHYFGIMTDWDTQDVNSSVSFWGLQLIFRPSYRGSSVIAVCIDSFLLPKISSIKNYRCFSCTWNQRGWKYQKVN